MAYNYFPASYAGYYNPYQQNGFQQPMQQAQTVTGFPATAQNQTTQQSMNGGFVRVQDENEARMYPVAPGNSVTFINENEPYCYTKSVDLSQLDRPKFEKYRLVKEEDNSSTQSPQTIEYATKSELEQLREIVMNIQDKIKAVKTETPDS